MNSTPALELLSKGNDDRVKPFLNQIWSPLLGVVFGFGSGIVANFGTRRPILSGIQTHILFTIGFTTVFHLISKKRDQYNSERDAVFRHYVELHPDDFPTAERRKIGDIFEKWIPVR